MKVKEVKSIKFPKDKNYSLTDFVLEDHPNETFTIQHFPEANTKDYLHKKGPIKNLAEKKELNKFIPVIKDGIRSEVQNNDEMKITGIFFKKFFPFD